MQEDVMRYFSFLAIFLGLLMSCQPKEDPQVELQKIENVLQNYFNAISKFDYQGMRDQCTEDYLLFEDGEVWTVEDHINFLKQYEGRAEIVYTFEDVKQNFEGSVAWITHRNKAAAKIDGQPVNFEWIESATFKKHNDAWKMAILHSTTAKHSEK